MGNSWGHSVRLMTDDERGHVERMRERYGPRFYSCATRGCEEPATHKIGYLYVTGRRGRVSSSERLACLEHARRFADKHELELPAESTSRATRTGGMVAGELMRELRGDDAA